jgi:MerR family mercuric resistance operon transcriptional regulator
MDTLTIARLAREADVHIETIRFYQRRGLLPEADKSPGGARRYSEKDVAHLRFIRAAQRIGFTLDEVAQLLKLDDGAHCSEAGEITAHKLAEVRNRIRDLQAIETALARLVEQNTQQPGDANCPLFTALQAPVQPD